MIVYLASYATNGWYRKRQHLHIGEAIDISPVYDEQKSVYNEQKSYPLLVSPLNDALFTKISGRPFVDGRSGTDYNYSHCYILHSDFRQNPPVNVDYAQFLDDAF